MLKDPCGSCGSVKYYTWAKSGDVESCSDCAKIADNAPRDAHGNKVNIPAHELGVFHEGANCVVHSSRQFAEVLRKNNWVLRRATW